LCCMGWSTPRASNMRWLFLFLLVVNVSYVAWEYSRSVAGVAANAPVKLNVPTIALLNEGKAEQLQEKPASIKISEKPQPEKTETVSEIAVDIAQAEPGPSKKKLPDKPADRLTDRPTDRPKHNKKPEKTVITGDACYTLGPFRNLNQLSAFTRGIKDYVIDASFRSREENEQSMFWVYLEPEASKKAADKLRQKLTAKQIKDHYIINKGPKNNGISLGHFKEKNRAYSHAATIKKLGFVPVVEPVFKSYTIYWLDYRVQANKEIPPRVFNKHLTQSVSRIDRPCS